MARRIGELINTRTSFLDETDIKQFISRLLNNEFGAGISCRRLNQGIVEIEVSSPTLYQEVYLFVFDLKKLTLQHTGYLIRQISIRQS